SHGVSWGRSFGAMGGSFRRSWTRVDSICQNINGHFYRMENAEVTKTLLCFM
ncbi:synaptic functional regulator FMR1-like, partial [Caligus rogercresseyi]